MTKEQILTEAMALDPVDRDQIAESLWRCVVPGELTPAQSVELRRRLNALDSGAVAAIPGEQVMQELRRRFQR